MMDISERHQIISRPEHTSSYDLTILAGCAGLVALALIVIYSAFAGPGIAQAELAFASVFP